MTHRHKHRIKAKPSTPPKSDIKRVGTVKIATNNIFLDQLPQTELEASMIQAFFEDFGGRELINIAREDSLNGQTINNTIIANHEMINVIYDPQKIMGLQSADSSYFKNFSINLNDKIPNVGDGIDLNGNMDGSIVYIDLDNNIVIDVVNLTANERVEVELITFDSVNDDTIYL